MFTNKEDALTQLTTTLQDLQTKYNSYRKQLTPQLHKLKKFSLADFHFWIVLPSLFHHPEALAHILPNNALNFTNQQEQDQDSVPPIDKLSLKFMHARKRQLEIVFLFIKKYHFGAKPRFNFNQSNFLLIRHLPRKLIAFYSNFIRKNTRANLQLINPVSLHNYSQKKYEYPTQEQPQKIAIKILNKWISQFQQAQNQTLRNITWNSLTTPSQKKHWNNQYKKIQDFWSVYVTTQGQVPLLERINQEKSKQKITISSLSVLEVLQKITYKTNNGNQKIAISGTTFSQELNLNIRLVWRSLKILAQAGIINIKSGKLKGRANLYEVLQTQIKSTTQFIKFNPAIKQKITLRALHFAILVHTCWATKQGNRKVNISFSNLTTKFGYSSQTISKAYHKLAAAELIRLSKIRKDDGTFFYQLEMNLATYLNESFQQRNIPKEIRDNPLSNLFSTLT